jgi:hypothetical protein
LSLSFILFFPLLLLFAFTGTELGKLWNARARRAPLGPDSAGKA